MCWCHILMLFLAAEAGILRKSTTTATVSKYLDLLSHYEERALIEYVSPSPRQPLAGGRKTLCSAAEENENTLAGGLGQVKQ